MSLADNYPVGMDFCTSQGLNGNCNYVCRKLADLECPILDEIDISEIIDSRKFHGFSEDEIEETKKEIYHELKCRETYPS